MEKSFEKHPAYEEENTEIKTPEELEEAKKAAGVANYEEIMKRCKDVAEEDQMEKEKEFEKNLPDDEKKLLEQTRSYANENGIIHGKKFRIDFNDNYLGQKSIIALFQRFKVYPDKATLLFKILSASDGGYGYTIGEIKDLNLEDEKEVPLKNIKEIIAGSY